MNALDRWFGSDLAREMARMSRLDAEVPFVISLPGGDSSDVFLEGEIDLLGFDESGSCAHVVDYKTGDAGLTLEQIRKRHAMQAGYYADVLLRLGYTSVECAFVCVELEDASGEPVVARYSFDSSNIHSFF